MNAVKEVGTDPAVAEQRSELIKGKREDEYSRATPYARSLRHATRL
jgi:hypothetical protein